MADPIDLTLVDSIEVKPTAPFNFRHTLWKPSHFHTGLEQHSATKSWRTFRIDEKVAGVSASMTTDGAIKFEVYSNSEWSPEQSQQLRKHVTHAYGLNEDLAPFTAIASKVPAMEGPLERLGGMRQSCPENLFEISIVSLLLQNATISRTTQMMNNLLSHYGGWARFDGVELRTFFTPKEIVNIAEQQLRDMDRLGYRAKYIGRFAEFFLENPTEEFESNDPEFLAKKFQVIKGVGPYTSAIIAGHAIRDHSAFGLDVWNRKIVARRLFDLEDARPEFIRAEMTRLFPGWEGLAGLYLVEDEYLDNPTSPLVIAS